MNIRSDQKGIDLVGVAGQRERRFVIAPLMDSSIETRCFADGDFAAADRLRHAAGWNQTLADWQRMVALDPAGCFVAVDDGEVAGTAMTVSYGLELAWIGMVLVDPDRRSRGIGRGLLLHCLDYLRAKGVRCIKLDATPAGQVLYEKLGFEFEWPLMRWMRNAPANIKPAASDGVSTVEGRDAGAIEQLDRNAIGVARPDLLHGLREHALQGLVARGSNEVLDGFGFLRAGINADYLGPVVAKTETAGRALVGNLLAGTERPVFWDIPGPCESASVLAKELGFTHQRPLVRMHLGPNRSPGNPKILWGISDPATG